MAALTIATIPSPLLAQEAPATADAATDATAPVVEPEAIAALDKMGESLRALTDWSVDAVATNETVLDTGQKLQFGGTVRIVAHKPDRLLISVKSDTQSRDFYYNGKTVAVVAPKLKYYAEKPAPPTTKEVLAALNDKFGIDIPLADLFLWGTDPKYKAALISGYTVRPATIDGQSCMQYAFRQDSADWQVWLPASGPSLPCKLVITSTDDDSMPQYSAILKWKTGTPAPAGTFDFKPPAGYNKIALPEVSEGDAK